MPNYYVNKNAQPNGDHEVHDDTVGACSNPAQLSNRDSLGYHTNCQSAVAAATAKGYRRANGCKFCARVCHTS